jgi:ArsR family transcriptional regulator, arsenate/arsenite/antimonite-responsive transcriptional repressor
MSHFGKALADPAPLRSCPSIQLRFWPREQWRSVEGVGFDRINRKSPSEPASRAGLVESDRRGMNIFHRPHHDAIGALCVVLDPNCCT